MLLLTFALGLLAVLASWRGITERVGAFHFMILWTVAGLAGVFLSLDLFLFYFFFEMMLIPMYFLIAVWGHEKRVYAAIKFFIFTQVERPADAGRDHRAGVHPRARDRRLHLRLHAAAGHADGGEHGLRAHARVLRRLRRQAAGVAAAHLAAGRAHRGADRRLRAAGRRAHQDRRLRHAPLHGAALPRRRARLPHRGAHPRRDRHHLRRGHGLRPEGHEAAGRLHERQPHGLRAPRDLRLELARRCRA